MKRSGFDHPKLGRLCKILGVPRYAAVGIVESLWHFTAKHAPAGDVGKWSDDEIADAMNWDGESAVLVGALKESRLLDEIEGPRLVIHDWDEHCDDTIHVTLARKVEFFANGKRPKMTRLTKDERPQIVQQYEVAESERERSKTLKNAKRTRKKSLPSQALPSLAKPEPLVSSEPDEPASEPQGDAMVVLEFPVVGGPPDLFPVTQGKLTEYAQSYPGVDVIAECKAARQWCIDNPTRQKTFAGMPRFLNGWLAKVQNRGGSSPYAKQPGKPELFRFGEDA